MSSVLSSFEEEYGYTTIVERRIFEGEYSSGVLPRSTGDFGRWIDFNGAYGQFSSRHINHYGSHPNNPSRTAPSEIGALSKLLVVPVDIFCEVALPFSSPPYRIAAYLEPYDILNLARSTRDLNKYLMSRDSRGIWRVARSAMKGIPECPPDLSEAEYARLLFETDVCHVSMPETRGDETVFYCEGEALLYLSDDCVRISFCFALGGLILINIISYLSRILKLVELKKLVPALEDTTERLLACVPFHTLRPAKDRDFSDEAFYVPRVQSILKKYKKFKESCSAKLKAPNYKCDEDYIEYYKDWECVTLFMQQTPILSMDAVVKVGEFYLIGFMCHSAEMDQWLHDYKQRKRLEGSHASALQRHQTLIQNKLMALGYSEEKFPGDWDTEWEEIMSNPQAYTPEALI
ncbi:hypothetical protein M422DRAFT_56126 [Sphaerobolus stellatus SS14]|uniref:F-box domain-containing protein n=1 Tax=Sphaerobolus stellatus (strain SS14) TaxID=990650 RepID=A0A0C9UIP1_SPHS4|nr:hypothetical protein M422DRAFT_56126 [Sphaerobolus stellatus SS14]